ncbi:MAG: hypothetical protein HKM93_19675 [Desulfobacteraceae bacterium]|nr:hypothetical protein [Desulfobacteraceae bacterium]
MALRVLCGEIKPTDSKGKAIILFNPHRVSGDGMGIDLCESGSTGKFRAIPDKFVQIKEFMLIKANSVVPGFNYEPLTISSNSCDEQMLEVSWACGHAGKINTLSYLIFGEAEDG